jgi:hypothetical protein
MPRKIPQDAESMVQVAECLPIKCEALSSKCQYNKKKGGREGRREGGKKEGKKNKRKEGRREGGRKEGRKEGRKKEKKKPRGTEQKSVSGGC